MTPAIAPAESPCPGCGQPNPPDAGQCGACRRFLPGNTLSQTHGARESRSLTAAARGTLAEIEAALGDGPGSEPRYAIARASAANALARVRLLEQFLGEKRLLDSKGRPRPAAKLLMEASSALLRYLEAFGMTPAAAGKLGLDLTRAQATSLAAEIAAARRSREGKS